MPRLARRMPRLARRVPVWRSHATNARLALPPLTRALAPRPVGRRGVFLNQHHRQLVAESSTCDLRQLAEATETAALEPLPNSCGLHRRAKSSAEDDEDDEGSVTPGVRKKKRNVFLLQVRRDLPQQQQAGCARTLLGVALIALIVGLYYTFM